MKRYCRTNYKYRQNIGLLNRINYDDINVLKALIKLILNRSISESTDICIVSDIKSCLGLYSTTKDNRVLTPKQKKVIIEHLVRDRDQTSIAEELGITQQGVSILLYSGLNRIKKFILSGEIHWMHWTNEDKDYLMNNYGKINIEEIVKKLNRPKSKIINMYNFLKNNRRAI